MAVWACQGSTADQTRPCCRPPRPAHRQTLHQLAQASLSAAIPDERVSDWEWDHGRVERRRLARVALDEDISPFPQVRQLVRITREWTESKSAELKSETRYFLTSLWKEAASRPRKKPSGDQVLALLRGAVPRPHDAEAFESLNAGFHHHSAKPHAALRLLKTPPPQVN